MMVSVKGAAKMIDKRPFCFHDRLPAVTSVVKLTALRKISLSKNNVSGQFIMGVQIHANIGQMFLRFD